MAIVELPRDVQALMPVTMDDNVPVLSDTLPGARAWLQDILKDLLCGSSLMKPKGKEKKLKKSKKVELLRTVLKL